MRTKAGRALHDRIEAMNSRSFPLVVPADIECIEAEARAATLREVRAAIEWLRAEEWRSCSGDCHDATVTAVLAALDDLAGKG